MNAPPKPSRSWYREQYQRRAGRREGAERKEFFRAARLIAAAVVLWEKRRGLYHDPVPFGGELCFRKSINAKG